MSTVVDLKDAADYYGRLAPKMHQAAKLGLLSAAMRAVNMIVSQIIPSRVPPPVDRGIYRAGWKYKALPDGATYFNAEDHALFIEGGVRAENVKPGGSMIDALSRWVVRKGLSLTRGGKKVKPSAVAWAIARTMQKRGIFNKDSGRGLGVMAEMNERYLADVVRQEVGAELAKVVL